MVSHDVQAFSIQLRPNLMRSALKKLVRNFDHQPVMSSIVNNNGLCSSISCLTNLSPKGRKGSAFSVAGSTDRIIKLLSRVHSFVEVLDAATLVLNAKKKACEN